VKIRRLYIGDFGILRNQTLDELGTELVVIGGLNRAGKTTFLQVLRYLGYGFPQGANLPPPAHEYHVEASVTAEDKLWDLLLTGYSKPRVRRARGEVGSIESLFGGLDMFTYHQLFTISLDELRLLPEGVAKSDQAKLQSVLLGAGLAHVARLPKLKAELEAEAERIGGKLGNPKVRRFKQYHTLITQGLRQRTEALEAMDGYRAMVERLAEIEAQIEDLRKRQTAAAQQVVRMEILIRNYEDYRRWAELGGVLSEPEAQRLLSHYPEGLLERAKALREAYAAAAADYQDRLASLRYEAKGRDVETWQAALLAKADEIDIAVRNLSGISIRISSYEKGREEQQVEERRLRSDIQSVDPAWPGDFEYLDRIVTRVDEDELKQTVKDHEALEQAAGIAQQLERLDVSDFGKQFRRYALGAAAAVILGAIIGLVLPGLGIGLAVAGVIGLGLYYFQRTIAENVVRGERRTLRDKLQEITNPLKPPLQVKNQEGFQQLESRLQQAKSRLEFYRGLLCLTEAVDGERYLDRLAEYRQLWQRYKDLESKGKALDEQLKAILPELERLSSLARDVEGWTEEVLPASASFSRLAVLIEKAQEDLQLAKEVQNAKLKLAGIEEEIAGLVREVPYLDPEGDSPAETDPAGLLDAAIRAGEKRVVYQRDAEERRTIAQRIRHSFGRREDAAFQLMAADAAAARESGDGVLEVDYLEILEYLYKEYPGESSLQAGLEEAEEALDDIAAELKGLEAEQDELRRDVKALDTDETLAQAQKTIDDAKRQLEPLARKFAVHRTAALFLDTLYKQFLADAKDSLLTRASEVFRELTQGDYEQISPMDDLTEAGFQVISQEGEKYLPDALSRGTSEQLFLAVRLGRIQEIQPPLPVVFDDSLANFDRRHAYQAMRALKSLAQRHQVFVLTCHPELVEMIADVQGDEPAQYWQLDRGVFSRSDWQSLARFLDVRGNA
jgi:uncharacterized protein YhaN